MSLLGQNCLKDWRIRKMINENVLRRIEKKDLKDCVGKIICFWNQGADIYLSGHPHYYEWVKKVNDEKSKIFNCDLLDMKKWSKGKWMNIKGFNFRNNDWYVFDRKDLKRVILAFSIR